MWTKAGTPSYRSPELLQGSYNELTDMWSFGIIAYEILTRKFPLKMGF
jgi:calcium-dependent protein kinase